MLLDCEPFISSEDFQRFFWERTHNISGVNRMVDVLRPERGPDEDEDEEENIPMFSDLLNWGKNNLKN